MSPYAFAQRVADLLRNGHSHAFRVNEVTLGDDGEVQLIVRDEQDDLHVVNFMGEKDEQ